MQPKPAPTTVVNNPGPDKNLQERMRAATASETPPVVDLFTGKKTCHVFKIPSHFLTPDPLDVKSAKLNTIMGHVMCIGAVCALWDETAKQCLDVSARRAQIKTAEVLEQIDGHARMLKEGE